MRLRTPKFWYTRPAPWQARLLLPLSWLYRAGLVLDKLRQRPYTPAVPVISVGNLTAGGSGKTPLVIALARALTAKGHTVAVLTRGYGGKAVSTRVTPAHTAAEVGDEAVELTHALPNIAVWAGHDRVASARSAMAHGATLLLLDDGMQHWKLRRTVDLLVISATHGLGNGYVLPAGPLREPLAAAARVDAVVLMGDTPSGQDTLPRLVAKPLFHPRLRPENVSALKNVSVVAFCGIGLPDKFFARLEAQGIRLVENIAFADHHPYTTDEVTKLKALAAKRHAVLATTAKDAARLTPAQREGMVVLEADIDPASLKDLLTFIEGKLTP
jgi:tetraacyldisaccharide 4'-kinase